MRSTPDISPRQNHLLAALPADDFAHIVPDLEQVPLPLGYVLYEPGAKMQHVYFPTDSIVSLLYGRHRRCLGLRGNRRDHRTGAADLHRRAAAFSRRNIVALRLTRIVCRSRA